MESGTLKGGEFLLPCEDCHLNFESTDTLLARVPKLYS